MFWPIWAILPLRTRMSVFWSVPFVTVSTVAFLMSIEPRGVARLRRLRGDEATATSRAPSASESFVMGVGRC